MVLFKTVWKDIKSVINVFNRKYPPFPLLYFSVVVCLICLWHHILALIAYTFRENRKFVFIIIVQFLIECKQFETFCLAACTRLLVQYAISLSSLCRIIWRQWTYEMPIRYILSSVWIRLSIFSRLSIIQSIIQYVGLCFSVYPLPLWWLTEYIYTLFYYHHQIGSMNYYPLFRVRSWNNGVRCMTF